MELDPAAAGRALDFLGVVANSLVTLHADFLLGFIVGVAGLRRYRRGGWADVGYASFLGGLTAVLLLFIVFVGLRLDVPAWLLFLTGLLAAGLAWLASGALALRVIARRVRAAAARILAGAALRARPPQIPDRLPQELRSLDAHRR
ncbi:MAG TPA: hypothetical protein VFV20_06160 [Candidatus Limnocylindria bacterium]|nr:hypothetical protein [Candidatus Limnocylindria bacterium]